MFWPLFEYSACFAVLPAWFLCWNANFDNLWVPDHSAQLLPKATWLIAEAVWLLAKAIRLLVEAIRLLAEGIRLFGEAIRLLAKLFDYWRSDLVNGGSIWLLAKPPAFEEACADKTKKQKARAVS